MSVSEINAKPLLYYQNRIGVDNEGNPVYFDPKKVKAKKPIFIEFKEGVTPEQRKIIEAKIRQKEELARILEENGKINPLKDKVFLDSNGELTTWKPGLIPDPQMQEKSKADARKRTLALAGAMIAAGLALLFRGKITAGAKKLVNVVKQFINGRVFNEAVWKAKEIVRKGTGIVKNGIKKVVPQKVITKAAEIAKPVVKYVKTGATKIAGYVKNLFK